MTDATLKDDAKFVADKADKNINEGAKTLSDTADQVKKSVTDKAGSLSDTADQVKKTVTEKAGVAKEWAVDRSGVARDWALDQSDVIRDTVQTKPFISVGVSAASAFAAGLVLGVLLTRR